MCSCTRIVSNDLPYPERLASICDLCERNRVAKEIPCSVVKDNLPIPRHAQKDALIIDVSSFDHQARLVVLAEILKFIRAAAFSRKLPSATWNAASGNPRLGVSSRVCRLSKGVHRRCWASIPPVRVLIERTHRGTHTEVKHGSLREVGLSDALCQYLTIATCIHWSLSDRRM